MLSALNSDTLSLPSRMALSESCASLFNSYLPPSVIQAMGKTLLRGIDQGMATEAQL